MKFFRSQVNSALGKQDVRLQKQPYDHVLRQEERQPTALENLVNYIARNPERKQLVGPDRFRDYPYTGCLIPGYPDVTPFQPDFWDLFDWLYSKLQHQGLLQCNWHAEPRT